MDNLNSGFECFNKQNNLSNYKWTEFNDELG